MTRLKLCRKYCEIEIEPLLPMLFVSSILLAWDSTGMLRLGFFASLLHEAGHLLAWLLITRRPPRLKISLSGICLSLRGALLRNEQELILAAAGSLVNLLLCCIFLGGMQLFEHYTYKSYWFASANLLVGMTNLLPLPGLDGARILMCIFEPLQLRGK